MSEETKTKQLEELFPTEMPLLALRGLVMFPNMVLHFDVAREKSVLALNEAMQKNRHIFLVAQKDIKEDDPSSSDLYKVGVVAQIRQIVRAQGESLRVVVEGLHRGKITKYVQEEPFFTAKIENLPLRKRTLHSSMNDALMRIVKDLFEKYASMLPKMPRDLVAEIMISESPVQLVEFIVGNLPLKYEAKQKILEESSATKRLEVLSYILEDENNILSLEQDIHEKVREQLDKNQREYYLREQQRIIAEELGEGEDSVDELLQYKDRIKALHLSEKSEEKLLKEVDRIARMAGSSQEAAVLRGYLDTVLELPWNAFTKDKIDVKKAQRLLDREHFGLKKVKERVIETLAVRKLTENPNAQIICLLGPPGVGKTSIARSIADAMGRKYVRMSLGGVRDESDIRGHRKTYIAAMPGRIINALKLAGSANPLMLLDEIDKLGSDYKGDPSSALLEVLDGEQNSAFRDHYLEIPFDLSKVFFIATANNRETIPGPLLDRMEIIELGSYTREEKFHIAKKHLVRKQLQKHGITAKQLTISDSAIFEIIDSYTREAGVRSLERNIGTICRKVAVKIVAGEATDKVKVSTENLQEYLGSAKFKMDELEKEDLVGIANGLAWTAVGGEMLQVEVAIMEGTGKNQYTGSLGDVMKESVSAATTYIRGLTETYDIHATFYKDKDVHIHFPEGAVPKDGPSAGITTCTALISALTNIPVRHDVAMTGEITLHGRVLPIGGLKEKTMAAYKHGIKRIIIPYSNIPDLDEVEQIVKDNVTFVPVKTMQTVIETALLYMPALKTAKDEHSLPDITHSSQSDMARSNSSTAVC